MLLKNMGAAKHVSLFLSIVSAVVILVPVVTADDPLCEGLAPDYVFPFPHENNCTLYYECYNGEKTLVACPNGFYYNWGLRSCDIPALSGCVNGQPVCIGRNLDYLPLPDDCSMYVECYQGNSYLMSCPSGYWFDPETKECAPPNEANCVIWTTPSYTTPTPLCWGVLPNEVVLKRYEGDCSKYWRCDGAELSVQTCPYHMFFDEERELCDFPEVVSCDDSTRTPDPWSTPPGHTTTPPTPPQNEEDPRCINSDVSYWPHPVLCDRYIECYHNQSFEMSCPGGFYFSDAVKMCVPASESECGKATVTKGTTHTLPTDGSVDPECEVEGTLLPYPGDCTQFYECAEGKKVAMPCPEDLWFSTYYLECVYPYQARCPWGRLSVLDKIYSFFAKV